MAYEKVYREIREADDVTSAHIEEAADCREGLYGGEPLDWLETIDALEKGSDDDWGSDMDSNAITYLQKEVRGVLRERQG